MIKVYFDGACWPRNPGGHVGWGYLICEMKQGVRKLLHEDCGYEPPGETSNNLAEYLAVYHAICYLYANDYGRKKITIYGDSKLVVKQLQGKWAINEGRYIRIARLSRGLLSSFDNLKFKWIPRDANYHADRKSREGLKKGGATWKRVYTIRDIQPLQEARNRQVSQCLNRLQSCQTVMEWND